jgi:desulfoferrodoxin (superoxide reductase-like protein)
LVKNKGEQQKMDKKHLIILYTVLLSQIFVLHWDTALANQSSIQIEVPENAAIGEVILIRLHVSHEGNNFIHYTDWVYVAINGREIKRWMCSNFDKPESENFTRTIHYTVNGPVEITAESDCNIHGSAGIAKKNMVIK